MLEDLGIVGISWRQADSAALQRFALPGADAAQRLARFAQRAALSELAYLETCNRVEIVFSRTPQTPAVDIRPLVYALLAGRAAAPGEAERALRAWRGEGACEHLFLVAAGLDSAAVGEAEIAGQVRACHALALQLGLSGPRLELLFEEALRLAAEVRGQTALGEGRVSLGEVAVSHVRERLRRTPGRVALIGVSPMTERAGLSLAQDDSPAATPLIIVNRTLNKARALAERFAAQAMPLEDFVRDPPAIEALLSSTGSNTALLTEPALERIAAKAPSGEPPLLIDMAVPADIDPRACAKLGLSRLGMDDIVREAQANREARLMQAAEARQRVDAALLRLHDRFAERVYGPLFGALQQRFQHTAREGVKRLLNKELKGLGDAEREAVATWAEVLARRFAHIPTRGLRGLLHHGPEGALDAFLEGLDAEFADELRAALERGADARDRKRAAGP